MYDERFRGKVSIPDNPMVIADAALYLRDTVPALRIVDPVRVDEAAVRRRRRAAQAPAPAREALLGVRRPSRSRTSAPAPRSSVPRWPYQGQVLLAANVPVREIVPRDGSTAWADSWMLAAKSRAPELRVQVAPARLDGARPGDGGARAPRVAGESRRLQAARGCRGRALHDLPRCRTALVHEATRLLEDARGSAAAAPAGRSASRTPPGRRPGRRSADRDGDGTRALRRRRSSPTSSRTGDRPARGLRPGYGATMSISRSAEHTRIKHVDGEARLDEPAGDQSSRDQTRQGDSHRDSRAATVPVVGSVVEAASAGSAPD